MAAGKAGKPWEALGLSKSTFYRQRAAERGGPAADVGVASPRRKLSPTQDAVDRALAKQARVLIEHALSGKDDDDAVTFTGTAELVRSVVDVLRKAGC